MSNSFKSLNLVIPLHQELVAIGFVQVPRYFQILLFSSSQQLSVLQIQVCCKMLLQFIAQRFRLTTRLLLQLMLLDVLLLFGSTLCWF